MCGRELEGYLLPGGVELLREKLRQRCGHPLTHLGTVHDHLDRSVRIDTEEWVGCEGRVGWDVAG